MKELFKAVVIAIALGFIIYMMQDVDNDDSYLKVYDKNGNVVSKTKIEQKKSDNQKIYDTPDEGTVKVMAKSLIKPYIKNPENIDFIFGSESVSNLGDEFKVSGELTTKNDFGVTLRANYQITIRYLQGDPYENNNWKVEKVDIIQ